MNKEKKSIHWIDMTFMITIFFGSIFALFWFEYVGIQESKEPVDITLTYCSYVRGGNVCHSYVVRENKQELEGLSSCSNLQNGKGQLSIGKALFSRKTRYYVTCD